MRITLVLLRSGTECQDFTTRSSGQAGGDRSSKRHQAVTWTLEYLSRTFSIGRFLFLRVISIGSLEEEDTDALANIDESQLKPSVWKTIMKVGGGEG